MSAEVASMDMVSAPGMDDTHSPFEFERWLQTLGFERTARPSSDAIRSAYKRNCQKQHSDVKALLSAYKNLMRQENSAEASGEESDLVPVTVLDAAFAETFSEHLDAFDFTPPSSSNFDELDHCACCNAAHKPPFRDAAYLPFSRRSGGLVADLHDAANGVSMASSGGGGKRSRRRPGSRNRRLSSAGADGAMPNGVSTSSSSSRRRQRSRGAVANGDGALAGLASASAGTDVDDMAFAGVGTLPMRDMGSMDSFESDFEDDIDIDDDYGSHAPPDRMDAPTDENITDASIELSWHAHASDTLSASIPSASHADAYDPAGYASEANKVRAVSGVEVTYVLEMDHDRRRSREEAAAASAAGVDDSYVLVYEGQLTRYTIPNLLPGTTYSFRIMARTFIGEGSWSHAVSFKTSGRKVPDDVEHPPILSNLEIQKIKKRERRRRRKEKMKKKDGGGGGQPDKAPHDANKKANKQQQSQPSQPAAANSGDDANAGTDSAAAAAGGAHQASEDQPTDEKDADDGLREQIEYAEALKKIGNNLRAAAEAIELERYKVASSSTSKADSAANPQQQSTSKGAGKKSRRKRGTGGRSSSSSNKKDGASAASPDAAGAAEADVDDDRKTDDANGSSKTGRPPDAGGTADSNAADVKSPTAAADLADSSSSTTSSSAPNSSADAKDDAASASLVPPTASSSPSPSPRKKMTKAAARRKRKAAQDAARKLAQQEAAAAAAKAVASPPPNRGSKRRSSASPPRADPLPSHAAPLITSPPVGPQGIPVTGAGGNAVPPFQPTAVLTADRGRVPLVQPMGNASTSSSGVAVRMTSPPASTSNRRRNTSASSRQQNQAPSTSSNSRNRRRRPGGKAAAAVRQQAALRRNGVHDPTVLQSDSFPPLSEAPQSTANSRKRALGVRSSRSSSQPSSSAAATLAASPSLSSPSATSTPASGSTLHPSTSFSVSSSTVPSTSPAHSMKSRKLNSNAPPFRHQPHASPSANVGSKHPRNSAGSRRERQYQGGQYPSQRPSSYNQRNRRRGKRHSTTPAMGSPFLPPNPTFGAPSGGFGGSMLFGRHRAISPELHGPDIRSPRPLGLPPGRGQSFSVGSTGANGPALLGMAGNLPFPQYPPQQSWSGGLPPNQVGADGLVHHASLHTDPRFNPVFAPGQSAATFDRNPGSGAGGGGGARGMYPLPAFGSSSAATGASLPPFGANGQVPQSSTSVSNLMVPSTSALPNGATAGGAASSRSPGSIGGGGRHGAAATAGAADSLVTPLMSSPVVDDTILGSGGGGASAMKSPLQDLNEGSQPLEKWRVEDDPILITGPAVDGGISSSFPPVGSRTASPMRMPRSRGSTSATAAVGSSTSSHRLQPPPGPNNIPPGVSAVAVPTSPIRATTSAAMFASPERRAPGRSITSNHSTPIRGSGSGGNQATGKDDDDDFSKLFNRAPFGPQVTPKLNAISSEEVLGIDALRSDDDHPKLGARSGTAGDDVLIPGGAARSAGGVVSGVGLPPHAEFGVASLNSGSSELLPRGSGSSAGGSGVESSVARAGVGGLTSKAPGRPVMSGQPQRRAPGPPTPSSSTRTKATSSPAVRSSSSSATAVGSGAADPNRIGFDRLSLDDRPRGQQQRQQQPPPPVSVVSPPRRASTRTR